MHKTPYHTHCSVESVTERGAVVPSWVCGRGRQVVVTWTVYVTVSVQVIENRGHRSWWSEDMLQRNLHCSIYNIWHKNMGLSRFKSGRRTAKTDPAERDLVTVLSLPLLKPHPQPTQKHLPSRRPYHQYTDPGTVPDQSPSTNELCGPRRWFVSGTNTTRNDHVLAPSRTRISKPSSSILS